MLRKIGAGFFKRQGLVVITLVIFSALILFFNAGKKSFWEPDEGRYAEISREMLESGDWLTPRLNYIKHFDKPPLAYWLIGSSFKLLGQTEFAGHLPHILLGLSGILATFYLGQNLFDRRTGFLAALILSTSLGYPALARVLNTDIILAFFCLLSYLFFAQKRFILFYLALALGFMTKGPIILMLALVPICAFLIYTKQFQTLKKMRWGLGVPLFALVALPWFIYQISQNQKLLLDWTVHQTLHRIIQPGEQPFYFFIPVLLGFFFPWIFFLPLSLNQRLSFRRIQPDQDKLNILFLFLWFILPFIFFSCIGKKLVPYLVPLLPALAIISARFWHQVFDHPKILRQKYFKMSFYLFFSVLILIGLSLAAFLILGFDQKLHIETARLNIIVLAIAVIIGAVSCLLFYKKERSGWLFTSLAVISTVFLLNAIDLLPKIEVNNSKSIKPLALKIQQDLRPEDKVVNYRCFLKSLPFYLKRRTIVVERQRHLVYEGDVEHWRDYLLKDKQDLYRLFSSKDKVYCITYTWEFKDIKRDYSRPLYLLDRVGKYVLFTNREKR
ncbi:glycosyltransferase family 39 protein [Candidatus Omnitrophota bacterium]